MKKIILFSILSLGVAACVTVPVGGEGSTNRGDTLIAEAKLSPDGNNQIIINSARGWTCSGNYSRQAAGNSTTRKFPLSCSNGATGNAIMSVNSVQQRSTVAFTLNNGESGRVAFGIVS
jgi:hypothetical protein